MSGTINQKTLLQLKRNMSGNQDMTIDEAIASSDKVNYSEIVLLIEELLNADDDADWARLIDNEFLIDKVSIKSITETILTIVNPKKYPLALDDKLLCKLVEKIYKWIFIEVQHGNVVGTQIIQRPPTIY